MIHSLRVGIAAILIAAGASISSASSCPCGLPDAKPDPGGVSFDFACLSEERFPSVKAMREPDTVCRPLEIAIPFCDQLDGRFAVPSGQVCEMGVRLSRPYAFRIDESSLLFRIELPSGIGFRGATFACADSVRVQEQTNGSSVIECRVRPATGRLDGQCWWNMQYLLLSGGPEKGERGVGRIYALYDDGTNRFESASGPVGIFVVPGIGTERPKTYANGSFCENGFDLEDPMAVEAYARFMGEVGVSWLIPKAASEYPALEAWRRNGIRRITPYAGSWCANGYCLGDGKVPYLDRFTIIRPMLRKYQGLERRSVCPMSVIGRTSYYTDVIVPTITRHLKGADGLWVNWEPFMYQWRGCACELCGREFARFIGRDWGDVYPQWPYCAFLGGEHEEEGHVFRSWLHGRMMERLDECVREATGGRDSLGIIPGVHFEQMLTGWRESWLMVESRPIDFASKLKWINPWGPYLPWHASLPYVEERGRFVGHWVVADDIHRSVIADYAPRHRPCVMAAPQGTGGDYLTQPENFEMNLDAYFFNRIDACCPWTFPSGADARYWRAFANATSRAARYEDVVFKGRDVRETVSIHPIAEFPAPVDSVMPNMPWIRQVPMLLDNAYEREGIRIVAVFNFWQRGEAFFRLKCAGLSGRYEIVSDDGVLWARTREDADYGAEELAAGVDLLVGAARCRVFEIRPVGSSGLTPCTVVMTADRLRRHYAARLPALSRALEGERRKPRVDEVSRYD